MNLDNIRLELRGPQTGLSLYQGNTYLGTYRSLNECLLDMVYRFQIGDLETVRKAFEEAPNCELTEPYEYRGVCKAKGMVVIADSIDIFDSGWVHYEWSSFLNEKRSGRKTGNLVTVVRDEKDISKLPYALRQYEVMTKESLERIREYF